jgi:AraC family ethanolamine operon transcriptional activator
VLKTAVGRVESGDVDEHSRLVEPWEVKMRQMSPGQFRGRIEYLQINGILLYREHYTQRVIGVGAAPNRYFVFGSPSCPQYDIAWCGENICSERIAFSRPSAEVDFVIPESSFHVAVLVPEDKLLGYLDNWHREKLAAETRHHLLCATRLGNALIATIHRLIDDFSTNPGLLASQTLRNAIEWQLLGALVHALHVAEGDPERVPLRKRRLALLRAIDYAEDIRRPISGSELAKVAGVSRRTLELSFAEFLDVSPARFLRWHRLNRARSDLLASEPGSTRVKQVAAQWGYPEMGRFAGEYKRLFGESPSESLVRKPPNPLLRLTDVLRGRPDR